MSDDLADKANCIAIIGMSGRFPGAADVDQFWRNLRDGVESIRFFTDDELRAAGVSEERLRDPAYVKAGGFLNDIEGFDAELFGFTPREAEITDPQHRVFLECAWEALENAGYDSPQFDGRIGVYAGAGPSSYLLRNLMPRADVLEAVGDVALFLGNNKDFVPTRVCYKLDLKGPGISINTACSSSLVATHVACQALLDLQCDIALAGGVGIQVPQQSGYTHQEGGIGSPDGRCRAFDAQAGGTVTGNGAGIVVLKRLEDAIADGDFVHAVILSSAVNNDGADKIGYTAPSVSGQAEVIAEALALADIDPRSIGYVEAHGTGTRLGDPVEIAALSQAMGAGDSESGRHCAIGSVKTNIGHLDEASGVAGLIKAALAIRHGQIPPSLHFQSPNPEINFAGSPFFVNSELSSWAKAPGLRRAGVSSFGIGGTNAHLVLEQAPVRESSGPSRACQLLALSANSDSALKTLSGNLADHLEANPDESLADVCFTFQLGRRPLSHRSAIACRDTVEAVASLRKIENGLIKAVTTNSDGERPVAFLFPGQGVQAVGMAQELYDTEPVFREALDQCADGLKPRLSLDLRELLCAAAGGDGPSHSESKERLSQTAVAQPALFSYQYALAQLWISWGIEPQAMLGHSLGQYVAATLAKVWTLDEALELIAERGRLLQQMPPGAMLAAGLSESELQPLLHPPLSLAAVNSPSQCVASGPLDAIAELEKELNDREVFCQRLATSHAFHSEMVQPAADDFEKIVGRVNLQSPQNPFLSNISGRWISDAEATDPAYWARHIREPVRFSAGIEEMLQRDELLLIDLGPGQSLSGMVKRHPGGEERAVICSSKSSRSGESEASLLVEAVGGAWSSGARVDWRKYYADQTRQRLPLPTYPFERQRFWIDPPAPTGLAPVVGVSDDSETFGGLSENECVKDWLRVPVWRKTDSAVVPRLSQPETWLAFVDEAGVALSLAERLRQQGHTIIKIGEGEQFEQLSPDAFRLRPAHADDYRALCEALSVAGHQPSRVLHTWNLSSPDVDGASVIDRSIHSLVCLMQAIGAWRRASDLQIDVLSNGLHRVDSKDAPCAEKSLLTGPLRVMPLEYPQVTCRSIDVPGGVPTTENFGALIDPILSELAAPVEEPFVAMRGEHRFVPALERPPEDSNEIPLRDRGVYLITGGLGSMGLAFARHLARKARARLVLVGRSSLGPEVEPSSSEHENCEEKLQYRKCERKREQPGRKNYDAVEGTLNELCASLVWEYFVSSGGGLSPGETCSRGDLRIRMKVQPEFNRFFDRLLSFLVADKILERLDDRVFRTNRELRSVTEIRNDIELRFSSFAGLAKLLCHCADNYGAAFSGETKAITVLYPDGTPAFMNQCLAGLGEFDDDEMYREIAADIISDLPDQGRPLRILEVGGGTGGLTRLVAGQLRGRDVEYWFTDLSRSFVIAAQREAVEHGLDFMKFAQLDISTDPQQQGFVESEFDVVIGYNVVHAAPDIVRCLDHLSGLLAPDGMLLLAETVWQRRWIDMIWGLTDGWWCYEDESLRGGGPLMDLDTWDRVLSGERFKNVVTLPRDRESRMKTDSGLIIAQRSKSGINTAMADSRIANSTEDRRERVAAIERDGGEVLVIQADVTDSDQMREVVRQATEKFGAIHGVIHTAGVIGQGLIQSKTAAEIEEVLAPKVAGARVLEEVVDESELDFFVACSSLASTRPIAGQVDYCAANAFLDGFAQEHSTDTQRVTIDWGFWQELGMIEKSQMAESEKRSILAAIKDNHWAQAGVAVFEHVLKCGVAGQVLVSPDFAVAAEAVESAPKVAASPSLPTSNSTLHQRPDLETTFVAPRNAMENALVEIWQQLLGIDQVGVEDSFFDLHGDSLLVAQLVSRIQQAFHVALPISEVFEANTVSAQIERIKEHSGAVGAVAQSSRLPDSELEEGEI